MASMTTYYFRFVDLHGKYVSGHFVYCDHDAAAQTYANDLLTLTGVTSIEILKDGRLIHEAKMSSGCWPPTTIR